MHEQIEYEELWRQSLRWASILLAQRCHKMANSGSQEDGNSVVRTNEWDGKEFNRQGMKLVWTRSDKDEVRGERDRTRREKGAWWVLRELPKKLMRLKAHQKCHVERPSRSFNRELVVCAVRSTTVR